MATFSVIVPTLNEESDLPRLLESIRAQTKSVFEVIVVDGGSTDGTVDVARRSGAKLLVCPGTSEFASRNIGSKIAVGEWLINTAADIVWPPYLTERIERYVSVNPALVGLTGPGIPVDAPLWGRAEYWIYNLSRLALSSWGRFLTSTNLLACPKRVFDASGGLIPDDVNADGKFGRYLATIGPTKFAMDTSVLISSRRMQAGPFGFNKTFLYVAENVLPRLERSKVFQRLKEESTVRHSKRSED